MRSNRIDSETPGEFGVDDLGKAAFAEEEDHALEVADHIGEGKIAPPEGGELGLCFCGGRSERLAKLLVAHELDARGKGFEQLERHLLGGVIKSVFGGGSDKCLLVGRALAPTLDHILGDAVDIGGDARSEAAAESPCPANFGQRLGTVHHAVGFSERLGPVAIK